MPQSTYLCLLVSVIYVLGMAVLYCGAALLSWLAHPHIGLGPFTSMARNEFTDLFLGIRLFGYAATVLGLLIAVSSLIWLRPVSRTKGAK